MEEEIKSLIIGGTILSMSIITILAKPYIPTLLLFSVGMVVSIAIPCALIIIIGTLILLRR